LNVLNKKRHQAAMNSGKTKLIFLHPLLFGALNKKAALCGNEFRQNKTALQIASFQ